MYKKMQRHTSNTSADKINCSVKVTYTVNYLYGNNMHIYVFMTYFCQDSTGQPNDLRSCLIFAGKNVASFLTIDRK